MDVTAIFKLPVPIWITRGALGSTYPTGMSGLRFDVKMPQDREPAGGAPEMLGPEWTTGGEGEEIVWTQEYGAFIPESLRPAMALHRVVLTNVEAPTDEHRVWRTADQQLGENLGRWFNGLRTWAEIITGQDLDPNHRVYDAEFLADGLTFVEPNHDGPLGLRVSTPNVSPLRAEEWAMILELVRDGQDPPLEEVLSRDARAAARRGANRRAILDAAIALEISLGEYVRASIDRLPERQKGRINDRSALGDYIAIADQSGLPLEVSADRLSALNRHRNNAAHRGEAPSDWDTAEAVQVMIDFLGAHGVYRRSREREPDGSEWVVDPEG